MCVLLYIVLDCHLSRTRLIWSEGNNVLGYGGFNGSYVDVALRVLPVYPESPTHAAFGWHDPSGSKEKGCKGGMTFSVFPLESRNQPKLPT